MSDEATIRELDQTRRTAMIGADIDTLDRLFAEDLVWVHANARVDTKTGLLEAIGTGASKYLSIDVYDETVRLFGDVVLLGGGARMKAEIKGEVRELQNRFTIVWARVDSQWKVVNWQSTLVQPQP